MSQYEITVDSEEISVEIGNAGGILGASLAKAGNAAILMGQVSASVVFTSALVGTFDPNAWAILLTMKNVVDAPGGAIVMTPWVSAFTANGFTISVNAPSDNGNYYIGWMLVPASNG